MIQQKVLSKDWNLESSHFSTEELFNKHFLDGIKTHFIYTHRMTPKPRLLIFGAGLDVPPVVRMAAQAGFSVTVCDWRAALCNEHTIPGADHYIIGFPNEIGKKLSFKKEDNVIIMTHNLQRDREILTLVKNETLFYLGILGSRKRTAHLFDAEIPHHIHSPVGIAIGAKGPYEIAISIVAELIQSRNGQRHV